MRAPGHGLALSRKATSQLLQLRLACVHPQLTEYWRQLSNELHLGGMVRHTTAATKEPRCQRDAKDTRLIASSFTYSLQGTLIASSLLSDDICSCSRACL